MKQYADLHVHTSFSDGSDSVSQALLTEDTPKTLDSSFITSSLS